MKLIIEKLTELLTKLGQWLTNGKAPDNLYFFIGLWFTIIVLCLLIFFTILIIVKIVKKHKRNKRFPKVLIVKESISIKKPQPKVAKVEPKVKNNFPRDSKGKFIRRK